jgi:tetratricopeptide (TPR) repeat protein
MAVGPSMESRTSQHAPFRDQFVVFTGRLSSLPRKEAHGLVARLGGTAQDEVTSRTTMVVVGAAGHLSGARGGDEEGQSGDTSRKLIRAHELNAGQPGKIRILTEDEFCSLADLPPPTALKQQYYAASDVRAMYPALRDDHIRYLEKWNLIRPALRTHAEQYFSFQDLAVIRHVAGELEKGASLRAVIRALQVAREGQLALDFRLDAEPARVIRLPPAAADSTLSPPDAREAERLFLEAADLDTGDPGTRAEAAAVYRRALEADPELVPAIINLANLYYAEDQPEAAQGLYERAVRLEPDTFEAHFNLGNVHHDAGRFEDARLCYLRALALNPAYAEGHFYLAVTLEKLGRPGEARPHWRVYRQLAPEGEWVELAREFSE